ncbi:hypothetical protein Hypma_003064 [Hypsizygus marmoreus]|uniref:MYND-type domain-containing protein n=1 Tax=Hypsizygus marmoreus TaxID=39966 RepID=A0A369J2M5_HYPMA|nr:hypothetical protein Hypma_003064 [Hypsizygus marmoreus]
MSNGNLSSEEAGRSRNIRPEQASEYFRNGEYELAKETFTTAMKSVIGPGFKIPLDLTYGGGVECEEYKRLDLQKRAFLTWCFDGIARCYWKQDRMEEALKWSEEARILALNARISSQVPLHDWEKYDHNSLDFIGNTGTAVHRRWIAENHIPERLLTPEIRRLLNPGKTSVLLQYRHPDPRLCIKLNVTEPSLQVMGAWHKIRVRSSGGPSRRMGFASFIWKGHLYIAGGRKDSLGPFYRDIFSLNLATRDAWMALPPYPVPFRVSGAFLGWHMVPDPDTGRAYLFTGRPTVDYFDLNTKTWGSMVTTFKRKDPQDAKGGIKPGTWPYPKDQLTDSTQQLVGGKLYVFGGTHGTTSIGCNLFMVLDLKTAHWTRLSGSVMPGKHGDYASPGPRKTPSSWVDKDRDRIFLIFGECDRMGARLSGELHGADCGYAYDDFWSWSIAAGRWQRERMDGNAPCPRSEVAYVYNPVLEKAIVWGGYNPDLPTYFYDHGANFGFSYYADTFIYDSSASVSSSSSNDRTAPWRQVLTHGFPTYRAQAQLIVDPDTGKTYLYGGFANNDYVPSRKTSISRSFGDLWQLRINIPGGCFEGVNLEEETRTAQAGPWQRCFTCGSAGPWKKCGGTCRGKAFFCDADCLKEGWKEHKEMHACRKAAS